VLIYIDKKKKVFSPLPKKKEIYKWKIKIVQGKRGVGVGGRGDMLSSLLPQ